MDFDYGKLPQELRNRLDRKLQSGEPFRLEVTPDRFVLEQPGQKKEESGMSLTELLSGFFVIGLLLFLFALLRSCTDA
ncbi:hypothetical protein [Rudanella lutea]|uniref:hypothetical protein n=1 Tax=Rudanella lutea TaxID=451374 RepID=UPI00037B65A4|nr:hypothetical protein [Rudanella lutea]